MSKTFLFICKSRLIINFSKFVGGTDSHVLIWYITTVDDVVTLDLAADLTRHQRAVNCVRWSPSGELLASCDDESVIFIWRLKPDSETVNIFDRDTLTDQDKEVWLTLKILRGHMEDIYDLSWSPNSQFLISGSVDNTAIVWDVHKGKSLHIIQDHKGFVQGVGWDPLNKYLVTISTDRFLRMFDAHTKKCVQRCYKSTLPVPKNNPLFEKNIRLFHDDTLQTFFRRLSFSPDGELIVIPSGVIDLESSSEKPLNTTYIYTRNSLKTPSIVLPSPDQYTVAVRFCPLLFELRKHDNDQKPIIPLPYRMIFAVATKCSVYLYDTQQKLPFGLISNIHYTRLTDLTWSNDGLILVVSSTDGYCSIVQFSDGELGEVYKDKSIEDILLENSVKIPEKKGSEKSKPSEAKKKEFNTTPQPIAVKRKPKFAQALKDTEEPMHVDLTVKEKENASENVEKEADKTTDQKPITQIPMSCLTTNIKETITVDNIIKSDAKFSPQKKTLTATPISFRKHPRKQEEIQKPIEMMEVDDDTIIKVDTKIDVKKTPTKNETLIIKRDVTTPKTIIHFSSKTPTPIEVRRQPRVLNKQSTSKAPEDDDSWPVPIKGSNESPAGMDKKMEAKTQTVTTEATSSKTPRRVNLTTISTPKSKKKLL